MHPFALFSVVFALTWLVLTPAEGVHLRNLDHLSMQVPLTTHKLLRQHERGRTTALAPAPPPKTSAGQVAMAPASSIPPTATAGQAAPMTRTPATTIRAHTTICQTPYLHLIGNDFGFANRMLIFAKKAA